MELHSLISLSMYSAVLARNLNVINLPWLPGDLESLICPLSPLASLEFSQHDEKRVSRGRISLLKKVFTCQDPRNLNVINPFHLDLESLICPFATPGIQKAQLETSIHAPEKFLNITVYPPTSEMCYKLIQPRLMANHAKYFHVSSDLGVECPKCQCKFVATKIFSHLLESHIV